METLPLPSDDGQPRDAEYWAQEQHGIGLKLPYSPTGALNLNVEGRSVVSPLQGFGQMWQKTYQIDLPGSNVTPVEVIRVWKENFPRFWPPKNRFYTPLTGIKPGEVALLNITTGGMPLSTGVMVLYADDESFTLMTPEGHVFAGWITFSAYADEEHASQTVAQAQVLMRANDPVYELGLRFGGHKAEDSFWTYTLTSLASAFEIQGQEVRMKMECVDPRVQWSQASNIWQNAAMRTILYKVSTPARWLRRKVRPSV